MSNSRGWVEARNRFISCIFNAIQPSTMSPENTLPFLRNPRSLFSAASASGRLPHTLAMFQNGSKSQTGIAKRIWETDFNMRFLLGVDQRDTYRSRAISPRVSQIDRCLKTGNQPFVAVCSCVKPSPRLSLYLLVPVQEPRPKPRHLVNILPTRRAPRSISQRTAPPRNVLTLSCPTCPASMGTIFTVMRLVPFPPVSSLPRPSLTSIIKELSTPGAPLTN